MVITLWVIVEAALCGGQWLLRFITKSVLFFFSWWLVMVVRGNQIKCIDVNDSDISLIALTSLKCLWKIFDNVSNSYLFFDCERQHHDLSLGTGDKCQVFVIEINCMIFYKRIFVKKYIYSRIFIIEW